ncbi:putative hydrophobe/amphiphile efflux-1 (HAE1) family transporter [Magnetofaba australis IT-1]|uniref:Efflux pump membrane transporter n=1 Tax=Magnetofaba australis IT-1 TaxID=1434232 RepID=A0A1Y2K0K8_9PROT|nr:putative hydrophobe/amphiphile efflux-1 (HAE1) family transporter [Magnetofaba australis IT-1]
MIALFIMLAGALAIKSLPIAQYPPIASPQISITASYPGATAQAMEDTVTQVIEQQMTGLDGMRYMSSKSQSSGTATITLTFDNGIDPDIAQMQVQNKLQLATPLLPSAVQEQGMRVAKSVRNFLMVVALVSEDGAMDVADLGDYMTSRLNEPISRVPGVGEITQFSSQYALRIWLDPAKLTQFGLTPADVAAAVRAQNAQISGGQLGALPNIEGQQINVSVTVQSRLRDPEDFRKIILRTDADGSTVRLADVARVEIGSERYDKAPRFNRQPAAGMAIRLATGANALETADAVRAKMEELGKAFPPGLKAVYPYDTTPFVRISIEGVVQTLIEAVFLVFLVMWVFLQNFRATLIPTIAVPVVLLGVFAILEALGFSINTLTMFAMVLTIGLLVDDAIVVVENVERVMREEGLPPREATRRSMKQITSALVGIALVLSAVFVPMAFFGGSTGVIYRQFSITIVSAMLLSVLVALTLTPALCATMLKPLKKGEDHFAHHGPFAWFNKGFEKLVGGYHRSIGGILKRPVRILLIYLALAVGMGVLFQRLPTSFLPDEDQGILFAQIVLPAGATQERTMEVIKQVEDHFIANEQKAMASIITVAGFSFAGSGQNMAIAFVRFRPWEERDDPSLSVKAVAGRAMGAFSKIRDAMAFAFAPPAVLELGSATGFNFHLQDQAGLGHDKLMAARNQFLGMAGKNPNMVGVRPNGLNDTPQLQVEIDHAKATALGVAVSDVNNVLSSAWGSTYVDDFVHQGRVKKVFMQADAPYRMQPDNLSQWHVRNNKGEMVPFSAFADSRWTQGSPQLERYNGLPSLEIAGQPAPGISSGDVMAQVEEMTAKLPTGVGMAWTGLSYEERLAGAQAPMLYALSVLVVFLALAALYESWSVPFSVMMVAPLGLLGAVAAVLLRGLPNDVYFQVGLLATIGLSSKNAILIVEFAKSLNEQGMGLIEAALEAARIRLRPILMTSLAFGFGVLPLAINTGAGSGSQNAIGTSVLGGMAAGTLLGIFFVPLFFVAIRKVFSKKSPVSS